ncbi:uncharacterized protein LOC127703750 [Mytilus californianus]|uniref:uncharacterized protein LOC127703750 n=1 Tax=Mytilus californianus TaxID=6549 RepID=UPI0022468659|nr:uncharacterized protein LOC127703750 [Mytilus californianus]
MDFDCYIKVMKEVADGLDAGNIRGLKFLLRDKPNIYQKELVNVNEGSDLIQLLERKELLSRTKVLEFMNLLQLEGRIDLSKKVQIYMETNLPVNLSNHDYYGINGMPVVENYIETDEYRLFEKKINTCKAALIKGHHGSGKTQHAYSYARRFPGKSEKSLIWRIDCKTLSQIYRSLSAMVAYLKLQCIFLDHVTCTQSDRQLKASIDKMTKRIQQKLRCEGINSANHLVLLDGVEDTSDDTFTKMLKDFLDTENVYVIATSRVTYPDEFHNLCIEVTGMTEEEAVLYFKVVNNDELEQVKELARQLSYLPLALSFAFAFIANTGSSIETYVKSLAETEANDQLRSLTVSCEVALEIVKKDLTEHGKNLLAYIPYLHPENIPDFLLKSLLPVNMTEDFKQREINKLIVCLRNNSLATLKSRGNNRVIAVHRFTFRVMMNMKTEKEKTNEANALLRHFCHNIYLDTSLIEAVKKNVMFLDHALELLKLYENCNRRPEMEDKVLCCVLLCGVAVTYRLYGNTELSANEYFEKARDAVCELVSVNKADFAVTVSGFTAMNDIHISINGCELIQENSKNLFEKLLHKGKSLSDSFILTVITNTMRNNEQLCYLLEVTNGISYTNNQIAKDSIGELIEKQIIVPFQEFKESFLVELMIHILYNSSKNKRLMKLATDDFTKPNPERRNHLMARLSSDNLCPTDESLVELQYSINLAELLDNHYKHNCPAFRLGLKIAARRGAILYYISSQDSNKSIKCIKDAVKILEENSESNIRFIEFGVVKHGSRSTNYQMVSNKKLLMECYIMLSKEDTNYVKRALTLAQDLESIIPRLYHWKVMSDIHIKIAHVFELQNTEPFITKAKQHYKEAYRREYESNNIRLTRYHLRALLQYVNCCITHSTKEDLEMAKTICNDIKERFQHKSTDEMFDAALVTIDKHLNTMTTPKEIISSLHTVTSYGVDIGTQTDNVSTYTLTEGHVRYRQSGISPTKKELQRRKLKLQIELNEIDNELMQLELNNM